MFLLNIIAIKIPHELILHYTKRKDDKVTKFADGLLCETDKNVLTWGQRLVWLANKGIVFCANIEVFRFQPHIVILY